MIDIRNEAGDRLLLAAETTLTLEQTAGLLDADTLPGGFSYPVSFPLHNCPPNAKFVGQNHRPAASGGLELPVRILVDGGLYRAARLRYKVDNGVGSGSLRLDYSDQTDELGRKKLVEVLTDPIYLGVMNPDQISTRMGEIARLPPGQFPLTFFPLRNDLFMEDAFTAGSYAGTGRVTYERPQYVNTLDGGGQFLTDDLFGIMGRQLVPFFYLTWVVEQLLARFGFRMAGGWAARPEVARLVILNMTALRSTGRSGVAPDGSRNLSQYWAKPGLHLPDLSVGEFLKAVRERFGLFFRWDSRGGVCHVDTYADLVTSPVVDLRHALHVDQGSLQDADRTGYRLTEPVDPADELRRRPDGQPLSLPPVVLGDGKTEITLKVGTTPLLREERPGTSATWELPVLRTPGNVTDEFYSQSERYLTKESTRKNALSLLVLSYQGLAGRDSRGGAYPLATAYPLVGESLTLGGRNGAWQRSLRAVFLFRSQAKTLRQTLLLPVAQAASLLVGQRLHLRGADGGEITALLDTLQVELPARSGLVKTRLTTRLLPPAGSPPAPAVAPVVYVELTQVLRLQTEKGVPYPTPQFPKGLKADISRAYATLTVSVWADARRSAPATPADELLLNFRVKETNDPAYSSTAILASPKSESTVVRGVQQAVSVIDAAFERNFLLLVYSTATPAGLARVTNRERTIQLDPGEGYILL